jgi:cell wall-associated NlpC family hydrolase
MSVEAVTGRIEQILAMQQQLTDPGSALVSSATSTSSGGASLGATTGSGSTSFSDALSSALGSTDPTATTALNSALSPDSLMASAISDTIGTSSDGSSLTPDLATMLPSTSSLLPSTASLGLSTGSTLGTTASAPAQVQAMTNMANSLVGKPYVYGGGHSSWGPQAGYDCSGFVSAVLHAGGYLSQPVDTVTLPQQAGMEQGPGQYVTVYDRSLPGENGHVIIEIDGQFYESGGSHGSWGGGGGVEKIGTPSAEYLSTFPTVLHPAGL